MRGSIIDDVNAGCLRQHEYLRRLTNATSAVDSVRPGDMAVSACQNVDLIFTGTNWCHRVSAIRSYNNAANTMKAL
ncbi:unnamed protein product [Mesocestoides corti]|nr:unnamed protein product [Mesocestoides corti]VDD81888.1 unnamed protein product [Mesocestoides corti]